LAGEVQESGPDLADAVCCLEGQQWIRTSRSLKDDVKQCPVINRESVGGWGKVDEWGVLEYVDPAFVRLYAPLNMKF
jgi:hypothetical protein